MFSVRLGSRYAAPAAAKLCLLFLSYLPRSKLRYVDLSFSGDRYNFDLKQFDIFSIILLMDVYTPLSSIAGRAKGRCIRSLRFCNAIRNGGVNWDRCRASPPIDQTLSFIILFRPLSSYFPYFCQACLTIISSGSAILCHML